MKRTGLITLLALAALIVRPAPAAADLTGFLGLATTPTNRNTRGIAVGVSLVVVGFEFEYGKIVEDELQGAPEVTTGMGNIMVMSPSSRFQLYGTTGGGYYREQFRDFAHSGFGTNLGGGLKITLAGPLRLRLDYRVLSLNTNTPILRKVHRFYTGVSVSF
jgi:hypothetical protein